MSVVTVQIKVTGAEGIETRRLNKMAKTALLSVGDRWHEKYLKLHFTRRGAQIFGYGARSGEPGSGRPFKGSYAAWKSRSGKGNQPLVKSGKGKAEALANKVFRARISSKLRAAILTISLPRIFNFNLRRTGKSKTNANEEIRRVTRAQTRDLSSHFTKVLSRLYEKEGRKVSIATTSFRG